ncbi:small integral membrane protein 11A-like isoform X2 [Anguilla anguilla]|uniref:small integral membrane protein 11A-like isoform X1 n=1 Tax=Anguilla anguilla TaxID=7936 RepID=UPI0015B1BC37|nr:small integral membrane protein 11A-like isoform X1 [Anguilla anguilla]XP_035265954.1 small integral membrane protein 11A-like isoform X2 [Anguilla anguilla]
MAVGAPVLSAHTLTPPQALDNVPLLFYILAAKTLLLCLGFAAVKMYQSRREEEQLKKQREMKRRLAQQAQELIDNKKDD